MLSDDLNALKKKIKKEDKTMKKRLAFVFSLFFFVFPILVAQYGLAAETFTLKAVTAWPKKASDNKSLDFFLESVAQQVAKQYPGELKINLVGGPEAVKIQDQVQAAQRGMVDIVHTTNAYYVSLLPEVDAMKLTNFRPWEERANGAGAYYN